MDNIVNPAYYIIHAFIREIYFHENLQEANLRKFYPSKIWRYTVVSNKIYRNYSNSTYAQKKIIMLRSYVGFIIMINF